MITVGNVIHVDPVTDRCICRRLDACGGVEQINPQCPEHTKNVDILPVHTHKRSSRDLLLPAI